jgi:hypothetical protein
MYVSQRASVDDAWGSPVNLGPTVNTASNEGNPAFSRDEHLMFFQSDRPGGFGLIDIWVSYREHTHDDFDWQPAVNLGAGVNTAAGDQAPSYFRERRGGCPPTLLRKQPPWRPWRSRHLFERANGRRLVRPRRPGDGTEQPRRRHAALDPA